MVTYEDAYEKALKYFDGDELAAKVYLGKYALTTSDGDVLEPTPDLMHKRLAKEFARIESKYDNPLSEKEIYSYLKNFSKIIPQGSPMAGVGNPYQLMSLGNCFVVPAPFDSYSGILKTDQELAQLFKRRCGVGVDISSIRPRGMKTSNAAKTTDGIGVFMERFSNTCREVATQGRRGAEMQTISVHHPEIETFIDIKRDLKKVTGANVSIRLTDEFMNAVKTDSGVQLRWPVNSENPTTSKNVKARDIWHKIIEAAHFCAEPGLLFWDTLIKESPADCYEHFKTTSTNPCSELPLSNYDSCRLLLINTFSFVKNPYTEKTEFDYDEFAKVSIVAQRLMDDLIDLELECIDKIINKINNDPEPDDIKKNELDLWRKVRYSCKAGRRTGLGVTGIGDTVAALNKTYGSDASIETIEKIYKCLAVNSYRSSVTLAKERGAFELFDYELEKDHPFINRIMDEDFNLKKKWKKYGRRNVANLTTAPCGSVSLLTQTTSGIEPAYLLSYKRRKKINPSDKISQVDYVDDLGDKWQEYKVFHHGFKTWMKVTGMSEDDLEKSPYYKATSDQIDWLASVKLQAAAQKWVDHAISKTCNLPKDTTIDKVKEIYEAAWKEGCKGFTVYREGSRSGVLVSDIDETDSANGKRTKTFTISHAPKRPEKLVCDIYHTQVKGEKWNFFVGLLKDRPYEIFAGRAKHIHLPKSRKQGYIMKNGTYNLYTGEGDNELVIEDLATVFENPTESAFTRTVSLALRHGVPVQYVVEQIQKGSDKESDMFSLSKGLMRVLKSYIKDGTKVSDKKCSKCKNGNLIYQEGCITCLGCGFSKCS